MKWKELFERYVLAMEKSANAQVSTAVSQATMAKAQLENLENMQKLAASTEAAEAWAEMIGKNKGMDS